jgi:hypothetical protein
VTAAGERVHGLAVVLTSPFAHVASVAVVPAAAATHPQSAARKTGTSACRNLITHRNRHAVTDTIGEPSCKPTRSLLSVTVTGYARRREGGLRRIPTAMSKTIRSQRSNWRTNGCR